MPVDTDAGDFSALAEDQARADAYLRLSQTVGAREGRNTVTSDEAPTKEIWWSTHSAMTMCSVILAFGVAVMCLSSFLALKKIHRDTVLKIIVIPMAIVSAIFLVVAGYTDSQIAPAMGLLGTVVGYVLGTAKSNSNAKEGDVLKKPEEALSAPTTSGPQG